MATETDLRQQILDASVALIEKDGLGALSMREVARRAGVSHQAPYHYFADKPAILAAIAGEGFRRLSAALAAEPAPTSAPAPKSDRSRAALARFEAGGRAYVEFARTHPGYFRVMFRPELVDLGAYPEALVEAQGAHAALEALVSDLAASGVIAPAQAPALVMTAWSMVHGLATLLLDGPLARGTADAGDPVDAVVGTLSRLLARAAGPRAQARQVAPRAGAT